MCHFITVGIPGEGGAALPKHRGFRVFRQENASISRSLPAGHSLWVITSNGCSCDLCLSDKSRLGKLRLRDDAAEYVLELVRERGPIHMLIHWYFGDLASEKVVAFNGKEISLRELVSCEFEPDTILKLREA